VTSRSSSIILTTYQPNLPPLALSSSYGKDLFTAQPLNRTGPVPAQGPEITKRNPPTLLDLLFQFNLSSKSPKPQCEHFSDRQTDPIQLSFAITPSLLSLKLGRHLPTSTSQFVPTVLTFHPNSQCLSTPIVPF
jgi:hypothetical protein